MTLSNKRKKKQVSYDDWDMSSINPTWNLEEMDSWTCSDSYLVVIA